MKKPNLFIVGAPKCGTTSLANWLAQHPDIYLVNPKEPNYFSFDLAKSNQLTRVEYEGLFKGAGDETILIDASTRYLYSEVALIHALDYCPQAKFIALVRDPTEMFVSLHNHLYNTGVEPERSAQRAWEQQWQRSQDQNFRKRNADPDSLIYSKICALGQQIERFFSIVPEPQRKIVLIDDLQAEPSVVWSNILGFLGAKMHEPDFSKENTSFTARFHGLQVLIAKLSYIKRSFGIRRTIKLANWISVKNRRPSPKTPISSDFEKYLREYFAEDIKKLSDLLERDLTAWMVMENNENTLPKNHESLTAHTH